MAEDRVVVLGLSTKSPRTSKKSRHSHLVPALTVSPSTSGPGSVVASSAQQPRSYPRSPTSRPSAPVRFCESTHTNFGTSTSANWCYARGPGSWICSRRVSCTGVLESHSHKEKFIADFKFKPGASKTPKVVAEEWDLSYLISSPAEDSSAVLDGALFFEGLREMMSGFGGACCSSTSLHRAFELISGTQYC